MIKGYAATKPGARWSRSNWPGPLRDKLRSKSNIAGYVTAISVWWTTSGESASIP